MVNFENLFPPNLITDQRNHEGPSSRQKRTRKGSQKASEGQQGTPTPSVRKRNRSHSSHGDTAGCQEPPPPVSSAAGSKSGTTKAAAGSLRSNTSASSSQLPLQARSKEANEIKPLKTVRNVKGKTKAQDSEKLRTYPPAKRSSVLSPSSAHESEINTVDKQSRSNTAKTSENSSTETGVPDALPPEVRSPVRRAAGFGDEETSEECCLMSYTALPPTPEKKVRRICHSIVKEGKAMVAFPSPSRPHPLPPQHSLFSKNLKDQMDTVASAEQHGSHSSASCSPESTSSEGNEVNQRAAGMFDDHSQLNFSNKIVQRDAAEDLHQGEKRGRESNLVRGSKGSTSTSYNGGDHHNPQSKEGPQHVSVPQGTGKKRTPADLGDFTCDQQEDHVVHESQSDELRGYDEEKVEEEEDSDVLRIEEHSENEYDDTEVVTKVNLRLSNLFEIFSLNLESESEVEGEQHTPSPPAAKQKREEKSTASPRRKTQTQSTQKAPTRCHDTPDTPKRPVPRKRSSGSARRPDTVMEVSEGRTEMNRTGTTAGMQSLASHKTQSPAEDYKTPQRLQEGMQEPSSTSTVKRRRITPIRIGDVDRVRKLHGFDSGQRRFTPVKIGDVDQHVGASKGSWGEPGTPKEPHGGQGRGGAGTQWET